MEKFDKEIGESSDDIGIASSLPSVPVGTDRYIAFMNRVDPTNKYF